MNLDLIFKYITYKLNSFTEHDVHSPFVYDFYMELIKNKHPFHDFEKLNALREQLKKNETTLTFTDFGVGSKKIKTNNRKVSDIAKYGIAQQKQAEFLYRLVNKFAPKTIIELGTSVGLTTLYLAKPLQQTTVYTIEGCPNLFDFSKELFKVQKQNNIIQRKGNFDNELPKLLQNLVEIDMLYIDGNHSYEATIRYFNMALEKKQAHSIFIFDDINWSKDMQRAWQEIKNHSEIKLSLDFFKFGIVFFRVEQLQKEHFVLRL